MNLAHLFRHVLYNALLFDPVEPFHKENSVHQFRFLVHSFAAVIILAFVTFSTNAQTQLSADLTEKIDKVANRHSGQDRRPQRVSGHREGRPGGLYKSLW